MPPNVTSDHTLAAKGLLPLSPNLLPRVVLKRALLRSSQKKPVVLDMKEPTLWTKTPFKILLSVKKLVSYNFPGFIDNRTPLKKKRLFQKSAVCLSSSSHCSPPVVWNSRFLCHHLISHTHVSVRRTLFFCRQCFILSFPNSVCSPLTTPESPAPPPPSLCLLNETQICQVTMPHRLLNWSPVFFLSLDKL